MPVHAIAAAYVAAVTFAQAPPPGIAGEAGWVGTGLLGAVLGWLLFWHLPAKDKQITDMIDKNDARLEATRTAYQKSLDSVVAHCEAEVSSITTGILMELKSIREGILDQKEDASREHQLSRHKFDSLAHTLGIKMATGDITVREKKP